MSHLDDPNEYKQTAPPHLQSDAKSYRLAQVEKSLVEISDIFADSLADVFDLETQPSSPPRAVCDFIMRVAGREVEEADRYSPTHLNRRKEERVACSSSLIAVPVNRRFARVGEPFMAAIRDVSRDGIRLLHTRFSNAKYLALSWRSAMSPFSSIRLLTKVLRCNAISPFYEISGKFEVADVRVRSNGP